MRRPGKKTGRERGTVGRPSRSRSGPCARQHRYSVALTDKRMESPCNRGAACTRACIIAFSPTRSRWTSVIPASLVRLSAACLYNARLACSRMGRAPGALLASLAALVAVGAQITEPGICPFSTPVLDWNEEQFVSEPWYEIKAFAVPGVHDAAFSPGCTRWHFAKSDDGLGLHARLAYRGREGDGIIRAFAQYSNSERYPRFNLTFHDLAGAVAPRSVDMKLIATDYDDFALLWGCNEPNLFERNVVSWVLSRRPFLSEGAREALRTVFRKHDIRAEKFVDTDHDQQTCGAPSMSARPLQDDVDSVFAAYRPGQQGLHAEQETSPSSDQPSDGDDSSAPADADVSWNYVGAAWPKAWALVGSQAVLVAVLLALAVVSLIASLLTFRALMHHVQRRRGVGASKPMLPVHRQDVVVATLGPVVDYSRFGGLGQGLVQTRKHAGDQGSDWPRT